MVLVAAAGCGRSRDDVRVPAVDLLRELDRAEMRPSAGFQITAYGVDGVVRPSIVMPVPSRVTWRLPLPRRGSFRAYVSVSGAATPATIRVRLGVSDQRTYEGLAQQTVRAGGPGWVELGADLSAYAGFKWSLFYRPDRTTWRVVLSADILEGAPANAVLGSPEIATDGAGAKEYVARRQTLRR